MQLVKITRRVKFYLLSTMTQEIYRFNHVIVLHVHKDKLKNYSNERLRLFGKLENYDLTKS